MSKQTAKDWKQSVSQLQKDVQTAKNLVEEAKKQRQEYESILEDAGKPNSGFSQKELDQIRLTASKAKLNELQATEISLRKQVQLQNATKQSTVADSAPDNTENNTSPANSLPGSNTQSTPVDIASSSAELTPSTVTETPTTRAVTNLRFNSDRNTTRITQQPPKPQPSDPNDVMFNAPITEGYESAFVPTSPITSYKQPPRTEITQITAPEIVKLASSPVANPDITEGSESTLIQPQLTVTREQQAFLEANQADEGSLNAEDTRSKFNKFAVSLSKTKDLRVRISLAPEAKYMYNEAEDTDILYPLKSTDGVIFPYTPQITITHNANYDSVDPVHSNYKLYSYKNSSIESISIIGEFTAQDTVEANYMLAVMHFFKTVTKMFYGKDQNPPRGTPPPLCYLSGYGTYAFDMHPIVIQSFVLSYPNDVHYINAGANIIQGQQLTDYKKPTFPEKRGILARITRLKSSGVAPGGVSSKQPFVTVNNFSGITRVPTKLSITLTALPIVTRNNVSNYFSLREYATGALIKNVRGYGGMW